MSRLAHAVYGLVAMGVAAAVAAPVQAQSTPEMRAKVNQHVVGIMAGTPGSSDLDMAADLSLAFSKGYELRIIPMVGEGSIKDVEDLLYLRGVDMAVVQQDVIDFMVQEKIYPDLADAVRLVVPLSQDQFHLLARKDMPTIYHLAGQKVNYGPEDTGSFTTSSVVFEKLGIDVEVTTYPHQVALEKLRTGEIAAMVRASAKPVKTFDDVKPEDNLHFLSMPIEALAQTYNGAKLTAEDYPGIVDPAQPIDTVSIANVLVCYNWPREHPRGTAVAELAKRITSEFATLQTDDYHEAWKEIDINQTIPGLKRFWAVEDAMASVTQ